MELTKINDLMSSRGYTKAVAPIFDEWEFVKDEILLPNRKAGSGNGTVHIYLLEDNMNIFRKCFPKYINSFCQSPIESNNKCPSIKHFVQTDNILTVADFAYNHYHCDANVFDYLDYVSKVIKHDDNGMLVFNSLFKLSTDERPYFKQFDKQIFGKLIRYIFVPGKTAYKLYLYGDDNYQNFAVFWVIGQIADCDYIINAIKDKSLIARRQIKGNSSLGKIAPSSLTSFASSAVLDIFISFMRKKGKSERTIKSYIGNLNNLIPKAQKMLDGKDYPSPLTITDIDMLKAIDDRLWSNPMVAQWNRDEHNRASAALHMYISMFEEEIPLICGEQKCLLIGKNTSKDSLTVDELEQMEAYKHYLQSVKKLSDITQVAYSNILLKKMSDLLQDYYRSDLRNVFSIRDYAKLVKMEAEIWDISEIAAANNQSKCKLSAAFRSYTEFVEHTLSDEELADIAFSDKIKPETVASSVGKKQQFRTHLPLFTIDGACGYFAYNQEANIEGWVDVSKQGLKLNDSMFLVHARGHSMEPKIYDGDLCIFQRYDGEERMDNIVLTQLNEHDSDYGGMYTIKKFHCDKRLNEYGYIENVNVELKSLNPQYKSIIITEEIAPNLKTIGIFVATVKKNII